MTEYVSLISYLSFHIFLFLLFIIIFIIRANFGNAYSNVNPPQQQIVRPFYSINNGELVSLTFDAFQQYGDGKIIAFLALSVLPSENDIGELYLELTASSPCNKVDSSWCYSNSFSFSSSSPIITFPSSIVSSGSNTILQVNQNGFLDYLFTNICFICLVI